VAADLEKLGRTSLTVRTTYVCLVGGESAPWTDDLRARLTV
jgi:hypothetical protein